MTAPLSHLRVLDLSRVLAGPWASQLLADLGAEVIKIEKPGSGDDTRGWGPPFLKDAAGNDTDRAAYFLATNRGKRSVTLDIAQPEGARLARELARSCDVVLENFKVGGLKRYGLDYAALREVNPRLVYCSITGFGQDGPLKDRAGYDFMIQAMGGLMSITGTSDGEPMKVGVAIADLFTGMYATVAILAALAHRDRTGEGQHVDLALLDCQVAMLANQATNYLAGGMVPGRLGNAHPNIVPYQVFATADGNIVLAVGNDRQFARFCEIAGRSDLAADARFATNAGRVRHRAELVPLVAQLLAMRTTDEWIAALEPAGVPCGPVNTLDRVFAEGQVRHRGLEVELPDAEAGRVPGVANPIRFSATPIEYGTPPPRLGEHTDQVLGDLLKLQPDELAALRAGGVI
ncbi:MAG TPA: CaiB/BaiF CoA-transferase family protein [Pelomicrobium sp.]|nr:CaiB/BaiF CoA-transferase family protein [Pelomicrobium sp.]